jgi:hypothetical protein
MMIMPPLGDARIHCRVAKLRDVPYPGPDHPLIGLVRAKQWWARP